MLLKRLLNEMVLFFDFPELVFPDDVFTLVFPEFVFTLVLPEFVFTLVFALVFALAFPLFPLFPEDRMKKNQIRARRTMIHTARTTILVVVQKGSSSSSSGMGMGMGIIVCGAAVVVGGAVVVTGLRLSRFPDPSNKSGLTGRGNTTFPSPYGCVVG
jgi:hypothetical protein